MCWFHWPFKRTRRQLKDQSFSFSSLALVFICCACVSGRFHLTQHLLFLCLCCVRFAWESKVRCCHKGILGLFRERYRSIVWSKSKQKEYICKLCSFLFFFSLFFFFFFFCSCSLQEVWLEQVSWKVSFGDKCDIHHATTVVQTKLL